MAGQNNFLIGLACIVIFSFAMINFGVNYAIEQNAPFSIAEDNDIYNSTLVINEQMSSFTSTTDSSETGFAESSIEETSQSGTLVTGSIFKTSYINSMNVLKNVFGLGYDKIFGGNSGFKMVFNIIIALVIIIAIHLAWKTWKGGNPE